MEVGRTRCNKGHTHRPWNTSGILHIARCESVCGFCQKEFDTAAKLRKHVTVHIRNDNLDLTIAEAASGRERLHVSSAGHLSGHDVDDEDDRRAVMSSPSTVVLSQPSTSRSTHFAHYDASWQSPSSSISLSRESSVTRPPLLPSYPTYPPPTTGETRPDSSPLANLPTKPGWIPISAADGFATIDLCRSLSSTSTSTPTYVFPSTSKGAGAARSSTGHLEAQIPDHQLPVPCYNRETIFDEEWQEHMKEVHGVYLLWPDTWLKRIEVLDLEEYGDDIGRASEMLLEKRLREERDGF